MYFSPLPSYLVSLKPEYSPQHPILCIVCLFYVLFACSMYYLTVLCILCLFYVLFDYSMYCLFVLCIICLFLSFRRVLNVNYSFLGNSPASEF